MDTMIKNLTTTAELIMASILATSFTASSQEDSLTPYTHAAEVPQTAVDLWKDFDPRKEELEVRIHKEWKEEGVVSRLITFKVGRFKGADSRIAAYYCFPDNGEKNPAFVWCHGGGQSASRSRGKDFARQGFATVDINWLGRPLEPELDPDNTWGTDWGKVDPTHDGPFYPKSLRDEFKRSLTPDAHSLDPILSPRNSNWFLLSLAGRRAISFLEQQPEVDPDKLGFAGFSMGGMITAMTAIDKRLKAVAPFIGGTGNRYQNLEGMTSGALTHELGDPHLHKNTIDPSAYWKHVTVPVLFITSSNDQYATLERIYQSMDLLPHENWRVSGNMHIQHRPRQEQWVLLTYWFKQYLAGVEQNIPLTPPSTFHIEKHIAHLRVTPAQQERLKDVEIYYSYGENPITRFWKRAEATEEAGSWNAEFPVQPKLPLFTFALCRYAEQRLEGGSSKTFVLYSDEHIHIPDDMDLTAYDTLPKTGLVDDFSKGMANWGNYGPKGFKTFKFQDPELDTGAGNQLAITLNLKPGQEILIRLEADGKYNAPDKAIGNFQFERTVSGNGVQTLLLSPRDFQKKPGKHANDLPLTWGNIATFTVHLTDNRTKRKINLTHPSGAEILKRIELVKP
jgi:dienelactone hydrolase